MKDVFVISAARTAVGKFGGTISAVTAVDLGKTVLQEAVRRAGVPADKVEEVIMGCVLTGGLGQNPARQSSVKAGLPHETPAFTINKVCGSGLKSVALAAQSIRCGDAEVVVCGGMENMSASPYILDKARWGYRMGAAEMTDSMIKDGLWDAFNDYHMGITAENLAEKFGITREVQDKFSAESQRRACAAISSGAFKDEIVPVLIPQRKGDPVSFATDEFPRADTTPESLSTLKPAFKKDGTVTAGNASGLNDGAAAFVLASADAVEKHGLKPIAKILSAASAGVDPSIMGIGPAPSTRLALEKAGLSLSGIDLFELNEAFAAQALSVVKELGLESRMDSINVNGGAIAIGHPIGASGARIFTTLLYAMAARGAKRGLASLCIGGGQGIAVVVEKV